ncbi:transposase family protein [Streptomyces sp. NPDC093093]|uniref:transposase family protein n=1 Tax=Streptomyces sp. NPDC093093 TaxID=3366025 RepID=UPI0037F43D2C
MFLANEAVRIQARTRGRSEPCPDCAVLSGRVHSTYERRLADSSVGGQPVFIELTGFWLSFRALSLFWG